MEITSLKELQEVMAKAYIDSRTGYAGSQRPVHSRSSTGWTADLDKKTSVFNKALAGVGSSVKLMHGGVDDFTHMLTGLSRHIPLILGGGGVIAGIIHEGMSLIKTYNKMADVGQMFGGNLFTMAEQAGASGMSLDSFTKMMEKHSQTAAFLNLQTGDSAHSLGELTMSVRKSLTTVGFFGMSMSEVTDATADFADTLLQSGRLGTMSLKQQTDAVDNLVKNASIYSEMSGKSRAAIMKEVSTALSETSSVAELALHPLGEGMEQVHVQMLSFLSALNDGGKQAMFFSEMLGHTGQTWNTEMGQIFNKTVPAVNDMMLKLTEKLRGPNLKPGEIDDAMIKYIKDSHEAMTPNIEALKARQDPEAKAAVAIWTSQLADYERIRLGTEKAYLAKARRDGATVDAFTKQLNLLENTFSVASGKFKVGFYGALASLTKSVLPNESDDKAMEVFGKLLCELGNVVGHVLGEIITAFLPMTAGKSFSDGVKMFTTWISGTFTPENINAVVKQIKEMFALIGKGIAGAFSFITSPEFIGILHGFASVIKYLFESLIGIRNWLVRTFNISAGSADLTVIAGVVLGGMAIKAVIMSIMTTLASMMITAIFEGLAAAVTASGAAIAAGLSAIVVAAGVALGAAFVGAVVLAVKSAQRGGTIHAEAGDLGYAPSDQVGTAILPDGTATSYMPAGPDGKRRAGSQYKDDLDQFQMKDMVQKWEAQQAAKKAEEAKQKADAASAAGTGPDSPEVIQLKAIVKNTEEQKKLAEDQRDAARAACIQAQQQKEATERLTHAVQTRC